MPHKLGSRVEEVRLEEPTPLSDPMRPYEMLEPEGRLRADPSARADGSNLRPHEPSAVRALLRGLAKRCPRCGERDVFVHWLRIRDRCPRCRLRLEREEGGFLGAMTINYAVTTLLWVAFLVIFRSSPDYATDPADRAQGNGGRY